MLTNSRDIKQRLERDGWILDRVKGSHHVFKLPRTGAIIVFRTPGRTWVAASFVPFMGKRDGHRIKAF